jgi:hypothetical protein
MPFKSNSGKMKNLVGITLFGLFCMTQSYAQNIGINTTTASQKLDVNGKIKIGNDVAVPTAGTIRYNEAMLDFEGFNGIEWKSLTSSYNNAPLVNNAGASENLGYSVAIHGNYAVVGAPANSWICGGGGRNGKAYLFKKTGNTWAYVQDITPTSGILGVGCYQQYGKAVAIYDNYIAVSAPYAEVGGFSEAGAVFIYKLAGNSFSYLQKITADNVATYEHFGSSLSMCGNYLAIGASGSQYVAYPAAIGRAYIFTKSTNSFSQKQVINNPTGNYNDQFGISVSIDSTSFAVGSAACSVGANSNQGKVYMYKSAGASYSFRNEIVHSVANPNDNFGWAVSLNGNDLAIGCPNYDIGGVLINCGAVFTVTKDGNGDFPGSNLTVITNSEEASEKQFGYSVAVYQNKLLVGAPGGNNNTVNNYFGAVHLYTRPGAVWQFARILSRGNANADFNNGYSVSLQGLNYIIGDPFAMINGKNIVGDVRY